MTVVACPHCRQPLQIDAAVAGQPLQCPRCRGVLMAPGTPNDVNGNDDMTTNVVLGIAAIVGHGIAWFLSSLWLGVCLSTFLLVLALMVEVIVWKWKPITEAATQAAKEAEVRRQAERLANQARLAERRAAEKKVANIATPPQEEIFSASFDAPPLERVQQHSRVSRENVFNSQTSALDVKAPQRPKVPSKRAATTRNEPIPKQSSVFSWLSPPHKPLRPSLNEAGARLPVGGIEFLGPQRQLTLDRGTVLSPMVYATSLPHYGTFDASLIDGSLPTASSGTVDAEPLPYWPSYHDASAEQRSRYLNWLVQGRKDPDIEIGYVFIYFYGLERRVLIDDADHEAIIAEVLRLRDIYSESRSFQRYSTSLLWMILAITGKRRLLTDDSVTKVFAATTRWDEETLGRCLAHQFESSGRLFAEMAFVVAQNDQRAPTSVIVRRHAQKFRELFQKKFIERFPGGMELRASKRLKGLSYVPASATLSQELKNGRQESLELIPDVLAISSQFKPLIEIWNECLDNLREYDKAHRSEGELSAAAYEALPKELRTNDHPEFDTWFALWQECEASDNIPLVPISRLASLKGITERSTLLKTQCQLLLNTADCLQIGVEPDARLLGRNYRWDDTVTFFFLEEDDDRQDPASYQAAAALLQIGLYIAEADGQIDERELSQIIRHIEDSFEMSENQSKRFESLRSLLFHVKPDPSKLFVSLRRKLSETQRFLVGEYLVGIAAADQVVTHTEVTHLQRVFAALDIPETRLRELLTPLTVARPADASMTVASDVTESDFQLDHHAISRIMRDTEAVASILQQAMTIDEDFDARDDDREDFVRPADIATITPTAPLTIGPMVAIPNDALQTVSLPVRFAPFFDSIVTRTEWSERDAKQLARQHGVMLSGAIEAINEWSQEKWGDWLIEEGDPIRIRQSLLERS